LAVSRSGTGIGGVEREAMGWQLAGGELVSVALAAMQELQAQKKGDSEEPPLWVGGLVLLDLIEKFYQLHRRYLNCLP
jgi:hypothetical protein